MTTFFTSDTHFGHRSIIEHCWRPFSSVEEMDEELIKRWNERVTPRDEVWHLGDFTMADAMTAYTYRKRLNGKIHLIWGNHDRNAVRRMVCWTSSQYAAEISVDGRSITLCHYAMRVWNKSHHGSLMLFGHSHGNLPGNSQSLDVGVDAWGYCPVTLPEILARMETLPAFVQEDMHAPRQDRA